MIIETFSFHPDEDKLPLPALIQDYPIERCAFLDIETTGFSPEKSGVYLIGLITFAGGQWQGKQYLSVRDKEESMILKMAGDFLKDRPVIVHFNGDRFDIPFLKARMKKHSLKDAYAELCAKESIDLFAQARPLKKLCHLDHMNQKSLERLIGLQREDRYDGGKLIGVYRDFSKSADPQLKELLLLHNREDLQGLMSLTCLFPVLRFLSCREWEKVSLEISPDSEQAKMVFLLPERTSVPVKSDFEKNGWHFELTLRDREGILTFPLWKGWLKHYFPDYKNYEYLPVEDMAIHKSVAMFVDKEFRRKATKENCYIKKEGVFLPQFALAHEPVYREDAKSARNWFAFDEEICRSEVFLAQYLKELLEAVLS